MQHLADWLEWYNSYVGNYLLMAILVPTGIYLTLRSRFVQLFRLRHAVDIVRGLFDNPDDPGDINHFQALCAALSATVGTGNIAGVALAIYYGGPGALFWMWVTGFFGMATKFTEAVLGQIYRKIEPDGSAAGGPMYYIEGGLKERLGRGAAPLAWVFAAAGVICSLGTGNMAQSNSIVEGVKEVVDRALAAWWPGTVLPDWFIYVPAAVTAFLVGLVIIGGIKRIGNVAEKLVPTMALFYMAAGTLIVLHYLDPTVSVIVVGGVVWSLAWASSVKVGRGRRFALATAVWIVSALLVSWAKGGALFSVLKLVMTSAFTGHAAKGGFIGASFAMACRYGVARGLFSNEAGQGSAPIAMAAAKTTEPIRSGFVSMMGPAIDTLVICSMTGFVILFTGAWETGDKGVAMTATAFERGLGALSPELSWAGFYVVTVGIFLFALSTAISWAYYGEQCVKYITGPGAITAYRYVYCVFVFLGGIFGVKLVWDFCDAAITWMAMPNLLAILLLSPLVMKRLNEYVEPPHPALEEEPK